MKQSTFVRCCCQAIAMVVAIALPSAAADDSQERSSFARTLADNDIEPTGAGAVAYLRGLLPDSNQRGRVADLIRQLGDERFERREAAMAQLLESPAVPIAALDAASSHENFEIRWRSRSVMQQSENRVANLMLAAMKMIAYDQTAGAADEIFAVLPMCRRPYLLTAAHEALRAVVGPNEIDMLREKLGQDDRRTRIAAAIGLTGAVSAEHLDRLYPLLDDRDDRVAVEIARAVANTGDRRALGVLVRLLESDDSRVRMESAWVLQQLTGEFMGFASYDKPANRAAAIAAWREWIATKSASAELHYPVARQPSARGNLHGNTLIATGSGNRVFEMDPSGEVVWEYPIDAWSAEKLPNGNVLIGSYNSNQVIEVDGKGNVIWRFDSINAMTAKPLPGGNLLVADFSGRRVVEIDPRLKKIVWEHSTRPRSTTPGEEIPAAECFDADRLANGNTIFGCPNFVCEVTPDHKIVNQWDIQGRLNGFHALPGGNIIVANYGTSKVTELTPAGDLVWELDEPQPCDVFRLPDGTMLVSTSSRIIEVSVDRKQIREISKAQYGSARR